MMWIWKRLRWAAVLIFVVFMANWTPLMTRYLIAGLVVSLTVLDVFLASCISNQATLSKQMQWIYLNWNIVAVVWGGLGIHFFMPKYEQWPGYWIQIKPVLCMVFGAIAFAVAWRQMAN